MNPRGKKLDFGFQDFLGFLGIPWDFLGFLGISWDFLGFLGISWDFLRFLEIPWDFWDFLGFLKPEIKLFPPCNFLYLMILKSKEKIFPRIILKMSTEK